MLDDAVIGVEIDEDGELIQSAVSEWTWRGFMFSFDVRKFEKGNL